MKNRLLPTEPKKNVLLSLLKNLAKNIAIFCAMILVISGAMFGYMYWKDYRTPPETSQQKLDRLCKEAERDMQREYYSPEGQKYLEELRLKYEMNCK